jgi:sensor domain CHASE-containing protein
VQSFVYPLAGNADALQYNLLGEERPQVAESVQAAIQQRGVALSSVFPLEQGRQELLVTRAIYLGDRFWGLAAMELDDRREPKRRLCSDFTLTLTERFAALTSP